MLSVKAKEKISDAALSLTSKRSEKSTTKEADSSQQHHTPTQLGAPVAGK